MKRRYGKIVVAFIVGILVLLVGTSLAMADGEELEDSLHRLEAKGMIPNLWLEEGTFDLPITRGEVARLLVGALGRDKAAWSLVNMPLPFRDLSPEHPYYGEIGAIVELGIMNGYADGSFHPYGPVTRQEMALLLMRAFRMEGWREYRPSTPPLTITDQGDIASWAREGVADALGQGFLSPYPDGTFRPQEQIGRGDSIILIDSLLHQLGTTYDLSGLLVVLEDDRLVLDIGGEKYHLLLSPGITVKGEFDDLPLPVNLILRQGEVAYLAPGQWVDSPEVRQGRMEKEGEAGLDTVIPHRAEQGTVPLGSLTIQDSMNLIRGLIGGDELKTSLGVDGHGIRVAVIDTGIDPSHPDLQLTPQGQRKIVDWVDFTDEGYVALTETVKKNRWGDLVTPWGMFGAQNLQSRSGQYKIGLFYEERLPRNSPLEGDINRNGKTDDRFLIVAVDSVEAGVYDTLYIDTKLTHTLNDELPLLEYRRGWQVGLFGESPITNQVPFVVSEIDPQGNHVRLGFDGNGHGTHVAGVLGANGRLQGMAPGVQLMALKAVDSSGDGCWTMVQQAMNYAVKQGVQIVNISLGGLDQGNDGRGDTALLLNRLSQEYGVLFVVAAGNKGPGLGTGASPGDADRALTVGAFCPQEVWEQDYGYQVPGGSVWYFSGRGPRGDGAPLVDLVAPGSGVATYPRWREPLGYQLKDGTSMATPYVSGIASLLWEGAEREGITLSGEEMGYALKEGARHLPGLPMVEQGYGFLDGKGAWEVVSQQGSSPDVSTVVVGLGGETKPGWYQRSMVPGKLEVKVVNSDLEPKRVVPHLEGMDGWVQESFVVIPSGGERVIYLSYDLPEHPGLYTGALYLYGEDGQRVGNSLAVTGIRPHRFLSNGVFSSTGSLGPGEIKRYFMDVPPGVKRMNLELKVPAGPGGGYDGKVRIHLTPPSGVKGIETTEYAGITSWRQGNGVVRHQIEQPGSGVWEVTVYSSASLSHYGLDQSQYQLKVTLIPGDSSKYTQPTKRDQGEGYLFQFVDKNFVGEGRGYVAFKGWEVETWRPVDYQLLIGDRLYQSFSGTVIIPTHYKEKYVNTSPIVIGLL